MAGESYVIRVRQHGAREVKRSLDDIGQGAKNTTDALRGLRSGLNLLLGLYGLTALQQYADEYTNLIAKLDLATRESWKLVRAEAALFEIANKTYSSFAGTADLYARLERSTRSLSLSQDNLLQITETVNKAISLSGASTQAANAAILQLGQGMAAGVLRGDELNSVLEQAPRLAEAIATGMGVVVGDLKTLGEQGLITTAQVVNAIAGQADAINEEFELVRLTIGKSFEVLNNEVLRAIGQLDQELQISETIARGILFIAENLDQVAGAAVGAAAGLALMYAGPILGGLAAVTNLVKGLTLALLTNPFGAIAVAIAAVTGYLLVMGDTLRPIESSIATFADYFDVAFSRGAEAVTELTDALSAELGPLVNEAIDGFGRLAELIGVTVVDNADLLIQIFNNVVGAVVTARDMVVDFLVWMSEGIGFAGRLAESVFKTTMSASNRIAGFLTESTNAVAANTGLTLDQIVGRVKSFTNYAIGAFTVVPRLAAETFKRYGTQVRQFLWDMAGTLSETLGLDLIADDYATFVGQASDDTRTFGQTVSDVLDNAFNTDYLGDFANLAKETYDQVQTALVDTYGHNFEEDYYGKATSALMEFKAAAEANAAERIASQKQLQTEYEKTNKILEEGPKALSSDQLKKFDGELQKIKDTLNEMNPTWESSVQSINAWKDAQLAAVDQSWSKYDEFAALVEQVAVVKLNEAFAGITESSTTALAGLVQAARQMESEYNNVAKVMQKGMGTVVDQLTGAFVNFAQTGKLSFKDLASGLAASIAQMMIRMLVMRAVLAAMNVIPGFSSFMASTDAAAQTSTAAGAVANLAVSNATLNQGIAQAQSVPQKFANGGVFTNSIVSSPTNFAMPGGGLGQMGEAGPEAVMPLTRGSDGKLGVASSGASSPNVNVYIVQSEEEAAKQMAANPDAINILRKAIDEES